MAVRFSHPLWAVQRGNREVFSVNSLDLHEHGLVSSPLVLIDEFRVQGRPFAPHPHAGFSAVTYILEDSPSRLRSRDSLGGDHVVGPGGLVWTQAGRGVMHEELPADPGGQLHGIQFFVNTSRVNKGLAPEVFALTPDRAPVWLGPGNDRVRVMVGGFGDLKSPLVPADPFTLLDITLETRIDLTLEQGEIGLIYGLTGPISIEAPGAAARLRQGQAIEVRGQGAFSLHGGPNARVLFLAGVEIKEPVFRQGPFIMCTQGEIAAANARFARGEMGWLARTD